MAAFLKPLADARLVPASLRRVLIASPVSLEAGGPFMSAVAAWWPKEGPRLAACEQYLEVLF